MHVAEGHHPFIETALYTAGGTRGSVRSRLDSLYNSASQNITVYQETTPPSRVIRQLGLWDAGNNLIAAARAVSDLPAAYRYNFTQMAQWNFIIDNAATVTEAYGYALDLQARPTNLLAAMCSAKGSTLPLQLDFKTKVITHIWIFG